MPVRKLSVQDVADLEAAWFELHPRDGGPLPGQIERLDADGRPVVLRIGKDLARWKNISEARFNELKAGGFVLKRGVPKPVTETVTQDSYRAMFDVLYDKIRQLEDENEKLRRERDLF